MDIDVELLRAEISEIAKAYLGDIALPEQTDRKHETYPAIACLLLLALNRQMEENIRIQRRILRAIRDDDD